MGDLCLKKTPLYLLEENRWNVFDDETQMDCL